MNHYEVLGVRRDATSLELKDAYRKLVKQYHPDINPSLNAKDKIRLINEAYEVLSDYHSKNRYDQFLDGKIETVKPAQETEDEKYRREFLRNRAREKREKLEYSIKMKVWFYKRERMVSFFFFAIGLLFSLDYYFLNKNIEHEISNHVLGRTSVEVITKSGFRFFTSRDFFYEEPEFDNKRVSITYSSVFNVPSRIQFVDGYNQYRIFRNLHSFRNAFSVIILLFSGIVLLNKEYTDFRLSCGLVPFFATAFLLLYVIF